MSGNKENTRKETVLRVINILVPIFCVFLTYFLTNASAQATIVERLSTYFDFVDESMSYEQALQAVYEESKIKGTKIEELSNKIDDVTQQKGKEMSELNQKIASLQNELASMPNVEFKSPSLISNGLKIHDSVNKSVVVIDSSTYYLESTLNSVLKNGFSYDSTQNAIFYNEKGENIFSETKIDLFKTNTLYDGNCYWTYLPSDGQSFSMGSGTYTNGFAIADDHSLFGPGDGYVLFDLQGKYSKINFDVGRTNEYEKQNVILKVYLNGEYVEEYSLDAQSPPISLEINLNYAKSLKLELTGGSRVKYGFANVVLSY